MFGLTSSEVERLVSAGAFTQIAKLYSTWLGMIKRCHGTGGNPKQYVNYRDQGVKVCERWRESFEAFVVDLGTKPTAEHTLDRFPISNGNYEPSNIRWATRTEQNRNVTRNVWVEHDGRRMLATDWAGELGITRVAFHFRMKANLPPERLFAVGAQPQVRKPKRVRAPRPRGCSVCRAPDHNRRTCANLERAA
jgi:hypothetical protein